MHFPIGLPPVSGPPWWGLRCPCGLSGAEPQVDRPRALLRCCLFQREVPSPTPIRTNATEFARMTSGAASREGVGVLFLVTLRHPITPTGPAPRWHRPGAQAAYCPR